MKAIATKGDCKSPFQGQRIANPLELGEFEIPIGSQLTFISHPCPYNNNHDLDKCAITKETSNKSRPRTITPKK